jgi:preprotein translocase subunit SecB
MDIELNSHSKFETESEIEEDYLNDGMVTVNAPAIVFPFIRAFINTVSTNAGYNPIILPAINFVALNQSKL